MTMQYAFSLSKQVVTQQTPPSVMVEHQTHNLEVAGSNPGVANKYFHPRKSKDKYYPQWDHVYLDADAHFFS